MIKFDIIICALNEEKNIKNIIEDIFNQDLRDNLKINKIIIVSDWSTDKTNEFVDNLSNKYKSIELIINKDRLWKPLSFNKWKKLATSEYLVSLDADIKLNKNCFTSLFSNIKDNVWLIWWNPIPYKWKTIAKKASYFSYLIVKNIKESIKNWNNFYWAHWRCLVLSKDIYLKIELPDSAWTDQYMYFFTLKNNKNFVYKKNAILFYETPKTIKDYLKQNTRFSWAINNMKKIFWENFVSNEINLSFYFKIKQLIKSFFQAPISWIYWIFLFTYWKVYYKINSKKINSSGKWGVSNSTK